MKTTKFLSLALAALLATSGCGPGTGGATRKVRVAIDWGNAGAGLQTKVIPALATRLTLRISGNGIGTQEQSVTRTLATAQPTTTPTITPTPTPTPPAAGTSLGADLALPAGATNPIDVAVDSQGNIWTANSATNNVTKFTFPGFTGANFSSGGTVAGAVAVDTQDNIWVLNENSKQLSKLNNSGAMVAGFPVTVPGVSPFGLAVDSANSAYTINATTVFKFTANGTLATSQTVGTGLQDVVVDASDNVWVTDFTANSVRRLDGNLNTTLGPIPVTGPGRIAVDAAGNVWVTANNFTSVIRIPAGTTTPGTPVSLPGGAQPNLITTDNQGNAWVTSPNGTSPGRVFQISPTGTVSGPFTTGVGPIGVAIDRNRANLYTGNFQGNSVTRMSTGGPLGLRYQQLTGSPSPSPAATAQPLPAPVGLFDANSQLAVLEFSVPIGDNRLAEATAFDAAGVALVCGSSSFNVLSGGPDPQVTINLSALGCAAQPSAAPTATATPTVTPTATATPVTRGTTLGTFAVAATPRGIAVDAGGNVFVTSDNVVTKLNSAGVSQGTFASGFSGSGIAFNRTSNIGWVVKQVLPPANTTIDQFNPTTNAVTGSFNPGEALSAGVSGLAVDASGNVWVANLLSTTVVKLSSAGAVLGSFNLGQTPAGVATDAAGNAWVTLANGTVVKLSSAGTPVGTFTVGASPQGVALDANSDVWVANSGAGTVTKLNNNGAIVGTFTVGTQPFALAVDNGGNVWVTNRGSANVTVLNTNGAVQGTFPVLSSPEGIAIDRANPFAWIASAGGSNQVNKLHTGGPLGILGHRVR